MLRVLPGCGSPRAIAPTSQVAFLPFLQSFPTCSPAPTAPCSSAELLQACRSSDQQQETDGNELATRQPAKMRGYTISKTKSQSKSYQTDDDCKITRRCDWLSLQTADALLQTLQTSPRLQDCSTAWRDQRFVWGNCGEVAAPPPALDRRLRRRRLRIRQTKPCRVRRPPVHPPVVRHCREGWTRLQRGLV